MWRSWWKHAFGRHLWLTNTCSCGVLLAAGDVIQQTIELRRSAPSSHYNWNRTGRMFVVGLSQGPPHHIWYSWLDRRLPARDTRTVCVKIVADQVVGAPLFAALFFVGMNVLDGHTVRQGFAEFVDKFAEVYLFDWCIWPPSQFINFRYVPEPLRVTYINIITVLWDVFLSHIKHRDEIDVGHKSGELAVEYQQENDSIRAVTGVNHK